MIITFQSFDTPIKVLYIRVFQKRTNSAVDMRVGIHTGAVLAGGTNSLLKKMHVRTYIC